MLVLTLKTDDILTNNLNNKDILFGLMELESEKMVTKCPAVWTHIVRTSYSNGCVWLLLVFFSPVSTKLSDVPEHPLSSSLCLDIMVQDLINKAILASVAARRDWDLKPVQDRAQILFKAADVISGPKRAEILAKTMIGQVQHTQTVTSSVVGQNVVKN